MEEEAPQERQVQVRFTTRLPKELQIEKSAFSLPAYLSRYGLSQIVNTLLGREEPLPFDFLVDGELLRTTLEQLYVSKHLSAETILVLEYIPAVGPPKPQASLPHEEWVSAVNGTLDRCILSGSYDGLGRIWSPEGVCISRLVGHKDAITCIVCVDSGDDDRVNALTSSKDKSLRLWEVSLQKSKRLDTKCKRVFEGHNASVQCAASRASANMICSGSWDSTIKLWHIDESESDEEVTKKARGDRAPVRSKKQAAAFATLRDHSQCVSAIDWPEDDSMFSVSWDHSIRQWDVETNTNTATMICTKALHCLSVRGNGSSVATGGADPVLRIWDLRVPNTVTPVLQLASHKAWVTSCRWHTSSPNHLLSSSHDGTVKMWDIRCKVPLQTLDSHKDKVLAAAWWRNDAIISGGADNELKVFKYSLEHS